MLIWVCLQVITFDCHVLLGPSLDIQLLYAAIKIEFHGSVGNLINMANWLSMMVSCCIAAEVLFLMFAFA